MRTLISVVILLIITGCGLNKEICDFNFFEKSSKINFPEIINIVDCFDSGEHYIWTRLQFRPKDAEKMVTDIDKFEKYSNKHSEISVIHVPHDQVIEEVESYFDKEYTPIPKSGNTYIVNYCNGNQLILYVVDIKTGDFWGLIRYPDWSGDKPC